MSLACREHQRLALERPLAERLHAAGQHAKKHLKREVLERTAHGIKAAQVVGIVSVPGATLEILPKIDGETGTVRKALVRMLSVAWDLRVADGELAGLSAQRQDLLELLVGLFAKRLLVAVRRGLPRRYVGHEEDLRRLRGSLNVTRQVTQLAARPDTLACRFDELSEDAPLNRVLKAAVNRLARTARLAANVRLLTELAAQMERVGESPDPLNEPVRLDRTNAAYHDLYRLARLFLSGNWQSTTSGDSLGFSLLFPMPELFEKFIGRCLHRAAAPWPVRLQCRGRSALRDEEGPLFELQPDAVIETPAGTTVLDTKWKALSVSGDRRRGVSQGDVYQVLAYGQAYDAKRLVLLYPWQEGLVNGVDRRWRVISADRQLDIATVDVGEPSRVVEVLRQIVRA